MKRNFLLFTLSLSAILFRSAAAFAQPLTQQLLKDDNLYFLENKGQIIDQYGNQRKDIDFRIAANGVNVFVGDGQLHYQWNKPVNTIGIDPSSLLQPSALPQSINSYRMDVTLVGANKNAVVITSGANDYTEHYYLPQAGENGIHASSYTKVTYKEVYPNIDWVIYVKGTQVEYDFVVRPGGNVADIQLQYGGATEASVNENGSFITTNPMGSVTENAPVSYQENGEAVSSRFTWNNNLLGFQTGAYQGTLIIDPTLVWGTYYGGVGFIDGIFNTVCDRKSNVYAAGLTMSAMNIATIGAHQATYNSSQETFLAKFNKNGTRRWGTYYGGTGVENPGGLAVDTLGHIYLSGYSNSLTGIATAGSFQAAHAGNTGSGFNGYDCFLVQFDTLGARIWGTYYGGTLAEQTPALACDGANIYMHGYTSSTTGIATVGAYQTTYGGGTGDCFLAKFNTAGNLLWSTYYGGSAQEYTTGAVACDNKGNVYIDGITPSTNAIATTGSYQPTLSGSRDLFLAKFNSAGAIQWATYFGGPGIEETCVITCDTTGNVYIGGTTSSTTGIADANAFLATAAGVQDAFVAKFNPSGAKLWSTYFGGTAKDYGTGLAVSPAEDVYLVGRTLSTAGITSANSYQSTFAGGTLWGDAYIAKFNTTGQRTWSTYFGGSGDETALGVYDPTGYLYVYGATGSTSGLTTPGSTFETFPGLSQFCSFVSKICVDANAMVGSITGSDTTCPNSTHTYNVSNVEDATAYIWELPAGWVGTSATNSITITTGNASNDTLKVRIVRCGDTTAAQIIAVYVKAPLTAAITVNGFVLGTLNTHATYQWFKDGQPISGANMANYTVTQNGSYTVVTTDNLGCTDTSEARVVTNVAVPTMAQLQSAIVVYPNPATDRIAIQSPIAVNIKVVGIDGKLVIQQANVKSMDINNLAPGVYLLNITDEQGMVLKTEKLTKFK